MDYIEFEKLIISLKECDDAYYNTDKEIMSDIEYDLLKGKLKELKPYHEYFSFVGAAVVHGTKVDIPHVLGSLEKTKPDGSFNDWVKDTSGTICVSDKLDGMTIYMEFNGGRLQLATTRGNGYEGMDITEKVRLVYPTISYMNHLCVRGEALVTPEIADKLGYKKARTAVSGIINRHDNAHIEHVSIVCFNVINGSRVNKFSDSFGFLESCGLKTLVPNVFDATIDEDLGDLETMLTNLYLRRKEMSKWDIDGLVVNDEYEAEYQEDYYPSNACAFKVNEMAVAATVSGVTWEIKRSGKLQPIVHFDPVEISGSSITKATGFNASFIRINKLGPGAKVAIVLSGEIIPYIERVDVEGYWDGDPAFCPSCKHALRYSGTRVDLYCDYNKCPDKIAYQIEHFVRVHGMEDMSVTSIKKLDIMSIKELYDLDVSKLRTKNGYGSAKIEKFISERRKTLSTSPARLLQSFGIPGIGKTMSDQVMNSFITFDEMMSAPGYRFAILPGIGNSIAQNLVRHLPSYRALYQRMKDEGLEFEGKGTKFKGKIFALTGASSRRREDIIKMIEGEGGIVKNIVKATNYLATSNPDSKSNKMKKARQYGVKIVSYEELFDMIENEGPGEEDGTWAEDHKERGYK